MVFMLLAWLFSRRRFLGGRIDKRAAPQTLVIPVTLDENLIYSVGVNMVSLRRSITTVAGANCDSCAGVPSYNPSASTSVQQLAQTQTVATLNGTASGSLVRENCGLMQSNGSVWAYPNQTVTVANQSASFFSPGPTFTYGMALNPPAESATDGGVLHWLAADQSAYEGAVSWKTISTNSTANISDWVVDMDAWSVAGGPTMFNISQSGVEMPTLLDPYYSSIVFPQPAARSIYASIPGSSKHASSAFSNIWKLPCNTKLRLTVTFGQFSTSLDQKSLVKPQGSICVGVIQEWNSSVTTDYLLGSPFIAVLYL
ncbi:aspartic peptidase domain-containing protein [Mycena sp. CBHHK59/15]|nr:aspartic peptidase domain-containing protein [Mycena sp. CBHHK59/15]